MWSNVTRRIFYPCDPFIMLLDRSASPHSLQNVRAWHRHMRSRCTHCPNRAPTGRARLPLSRAQLSWTCFVCNPFIALSKFSFPRAIYSPQCVTHMFRRPEKAVGFIQTVDSLRRYSYIDNVHEPILRPEVNMSRSCILTSVGNRSRAPLAQSPSVLSSECRVLNQAMDTAPPYAPVWRCLSRLSCKRRRHIVTRHTRSPVGGRTAPIQFSKSTQAHRILHARAQRFLNSPFLVRRLVDREYTRSAVKLHSSAAASLSAHAPEGLCCAPAWPYTAAT